MGESRTGQVPRGGGSQDSFRWPARVVSSGVVPPTATATSDCSLPGSGCLMFCRETLSWAGPARTVDWLVVVVVVVCVCVCAG